MTTLRKHLEAIRDRCRPIPNATPAESQAYEHAVAALAILDDANYSRRDGFPSTRYAYIRDPMHPHDAPKPA